MGCVFEDDGDCKKFPWACPECEHYGAVTDNDNGEEAAQ